MNIDYPFSFIAAAAPPRRTHNDHIRDLLEELLFTNPGERVNRPDFGSGLIQLVFTPTSPEVAAALQFTLKAAIRAGSVTYSGAGSAGNERRLHAAFQFHT